jgi:PAS domain S-box-containing protein
MPTGLRAMNKALRADISELQLRFDEAQQALDAIRSGEVDSLVVEGPDGPRVFSLQGADHSYRVLMEAMSEGAATLGETGTILYCNAQFARLIDRPLERTMGSSIHDHVPVRFRAASTALVERAQNSQNREEIPLLSAGGIEIPVYLSVSSIFIGDRRSICLVATDLREQKRSQALVAAQRTTAERERGLLEASRAKSEFLTNMSHELRTPLNSIIGFAELLKDGEVGPVSSKQQEFLGDILGGGLHLLQLINDILDLSKVESGKFEFHPEPLDLQSVIAEVRARMRTLSETKRIRMAASVAPEIRAVFLDPVRLKQVLYNYLSNALKFTPDGGKITIRARPEGATQFRIEVLDTGMGISGPDLERLFHEFQQLDSSAAKRHEGTGLGLALTKRLVEAQCGSVGASSVLGEGSCFYAILPRDAAARSTPTALPASTQVSQTLHDQLGLA